MFMSRVIHISIIFVFCLILSLSAKAQKVDSSKISVLKASYLNDDTLLHVHLKEVLIFGLRHSKNKDYRYTHKYWRTVRNIRIVYPYAKAANIKILEVNARLEDMTSHKERRKLIRTEYRSLMKEYKKPLMRLRVSQGKLLMKLIDRETGNTSYSHLKEMKGTATAVFWQSIATMFGANLKADYNPAGKDWMIEEILTRMANGDLAKPRKL